MTAIRPTILLTLLVACSPAPVHEARLPPTAFVPTPKAVEDSDSSPFAGQRRTMTGRPCAIIDPRTVACVGKDQWLEPPTGWLRLGEDFPQTEALVHLDTAGERICGLTEPSGRIACWDLSGLQDARRDAVLGTAKAEPIERVVDFALLGPSALCALDALGRVSCLGDNDRGQLGNGTREASRLPAVVELPGAAIDLEGRSGSACAWLESGDVYCWGDNGTEGDPRRLEPERIRGLPPVAALESARWVALVDGGWARWQTVDHLPDHGYSTAERVGSGGARYHGDCRLEGEEAVCPGLGDDPSPRRFGRALEVVDGSRAWCMRRADQAVWCAGQGLYDPPPPVSLDRPTRVPGVSDVTQVAASIDAVCAVHNRGSVSCWGAGDHLPHSPHQRDGFLGTPTPVPLPGPASALLVEHSGACALVEGRAHCWGPTGQARSLGAATALTTVADMPCARTPKGLRCLVSERERPESVRYIEAPKSTDDGFGRRCARTPAGLVCKRVRSSVSCPPADDAKCTIEVQTEASALELERPLRAGAGDRILAGGGGVCTLSAAGTLDCSSTSVGLGSYRGFDITAEPGIVDADAGLRSVCALASTGTVRCWSASEVYSEPGREVMLGIDDATSIAVGDLGGYVVRDGGTLWSWGTNALGQRGLGGEGWRGSALPIRIGPLSPRGTGPQD